jgi:hypothetical protein
MWRFLVKLDEARCLGVRFVGDGLAFVEFKESGGINLA